MKIGILAIQGDFEAHGKMLERLGAECVFVRTPAELRGLGGLVLPGGESTTHLKFLETGGLQEAICEFAKNGGALFGTCAGAILLAREVKNPPQASLNLLDMVILRNGYGRQLSSDVILGPCRLKKEPLEMVFIRAPLIEQIGPGVEVLAERGGRPVLVQHGRVLAATFHPELTSDTTVHAHFLKLARNGF